MRVSRWFYLLFAGSLLVAACGVSEETATPGATDRDRAEFAEARDVWSAESRAYTMTYTSACGNSASFTDIPITVAVEDGTATIVDGGPDFETTLLTVERVFEIIEGALDEAEIVEVSYAEQGNPVLVDIDWVINAIDDEFCIDISSLELTSDLEQAALEEDVSVTTEPATPTSVVPVETRWTPADAERMVIGYLAALADGEWEVAAFSARDAGFVPGENQEAGTFDELFEIACAPNLCNGPYQVLADGPGVVDPATFQASSTVTVEHIASGETTSMRIGTFEGQPVITDLPPLVSGDGASLVEELFGDDLPNDVVIGRFNAVERWVGGAQTWSTQWLVDDFAAVEGDVALLSLDDGQSQITPIGLPGPSDVGSCPQLLGAGVIEMVGCDNEVFGPNGELLPRREPVPPPEAGFSFYTERAGVRLTGAGDAEGNFVELTSGAVDVLGEDYASFPRLSPDGTLVAYVDHADERAESHFWSSIVVVKDTATGAEVARVEFEANVRWLEFDGQWLVVGERNEEDFAGTEPHERVSVHNLDTGRQTTIATTVRIWLP